MGRCQRWAGQERQPRVVLVPGLGRPLCSALSPGTPFPPPVQVHILSRYRYHSVSHSVSQDPQLPKKNQKDSRKQLKTSHPAPGVLVFLSHLGIQGQRGKESITLVPTDTFLGSGLGDRRLGQLAKKGDVMRKMLPDPYQLLETSLAPRTSEVFLSLLADLISHSILGIWKTHLSHSCPSWVTGSPQQDVTPFRKASLSCPQVGWWTPLWDPLLPCYLVFSPFLGLLKLNFFLNWSKVAVQYYTSYRCTMQ